MANLVRAEITGADFARSILAGADLTETRPWTALLYPSPIRTREHISALPSDVEEVGQLIEVSQAIVENYTNPVEGGDIVDDPVLYFRGHELATWELRPSVVRRPPQGEPDVRGKEGEILLDLMSRRPEEFSQMPSALSQWVLAQHHGLRTRLLDITRNPLVALYFACEESNPSSSTGRKEGLLNIFVVPRHLIKSTDSDSISVIANFAKLTLFEQNLLLGKSYDLVEANRRRYIGQSDKYQDALVRLYHLIGREKPHFKERLEPRDLFRVLVVEPEQSFERLRAQSGAFLISAFHERFEPASVLEWNSDIPIYDYYQVRVPAASKEDILRQLELLNVTRETLFPGLDEATLAVMRRHAG